MQSPPHTATRPALPDHLAQAGFTRHSQHEIAVLLTPDNLEQVARAIGATITTGRDSTPRLSVRSQGPRGTVRITTGPGHYLVQTCTTPGRWTSVPEADFAA